MKQSEFELLDAAIDGVARHIARALIAIEDLRRAEITAHREAYREVHDLLGDLGAIKIRLGCMAPHVLRPCPRPTSRPDDDS